MEVEFSTAAILALLQVSGGWPGDRGLRRGEGRGGGVLMVSGCHGDGECRRRWSPGGVGHPASIQPNEIHQNSITF